MKQWDQFVLSHPQSTPFHMSNWLKCIQKTYHYDPMLYVSINSTNGHTESIDGIFPCFQIKSLITGNRLVSLPFSDYGGPLFHDPSKENDLLLSIIQNLGNGFKYIEIRSALHTGNHFSPCNQFKLHSLPLNTEPERVMDRIDKRTTRYSIRKAKKSNIEIIKDNTLSGMETFYSLNLLTRKKHGLPPQPFQFLKNIHKFLILNDNAFLLMAMDGPKAISGGLFIKFKDTVYYKYNVSDPDFLTEKKPNHLLTWQAIEQSCREGFQYFDFGRTGTDNQGLIRYKELWGAKPEALPYYYYPKIRGVTALDGNRPFYRMFNKMCRHLPGPVLGKIGSVLYKHIG